MAVGHSQPPDVIILEFRCQLYSGACGELSEDLEHLPASYVLEVIPPYPFDPQTHLSALPPSFL